MRNRIIVVGGLLAALAAPPRAGAAPRATHQVPEACRQFTSLPADAEGDTMAWNQVLSLAACMQDATIASASTPAELTHALDQLEDALGLPMWIYLRALEKGPVSVQLRAAYQLGMMQVAFMVRARASIPATDVKLHARLEKQLEPSARIAWTAFDAVDRAATSNPELARDPVAKGMVRSARTMLHALPHPAEEPSRVARAKP